MAYDASKKEKDKPDGPNPYEQLTVQGGLAGMTSSPVVAQPTAAKPMGGAGQTATGHVNFDQLYNANAGVAQREATNKQNTAEAKAKEAQKGLAGAQNQFAQGVQAGSVQSPGAKDFGRAAGTTGFYETPNATPVTGSTATRTGAPKTGGLTNAVNQSNTEPFWRADVARRGSQEYSGPTGLSASDEYAKLAQDTAAAQDLINNPLTGLNQTDAALLGAAGRPGFSRLQQQYGGLKSDLDKANVASKGEADRAKAESDAARKQYEALTGTYDERKAGEAAYDAAHQTGPVTNLATPGGTVLGPAAGRTLGDDLDTIGSEEFETRAGDQLDPAKWNGNAQNLTQEQKEAMAKYGFSQEELLAMTPEQLQARIAEKEAERAANGPPKNPDEFVSDFLLLDLLGQFHLDWNPGGGPADARKQLEGRYGAMSDDEWREFTQLPREQREAWLDAHKAKGGG